jgi:hypothetical protein
MFMFTKKGYVPPVAAIRAATKDNREAFGIAVSIDNQIILQQGVLDWDNEEAAIKQICDYAESYKEGAAMYWFSDSVVKTAQPYEVFGMDVPVDPEKPDGETSHQVFGVACFDGDFEKHDNDGPESPEFNCFTNLIKPRCEKVATEVNGDIDKFQEYLHNSKEHMDAFTTGVMSETSSFCLLIVDTLFLNFEGSAAPGKGYLWGYMSNPYDYVEMPNKQGSVPNVKPKATGMLVPKGKSVAAEIDKAVGAVTLLTVHPPKSVKTSKELVSWYQTWNYAKAKDGKGLVPEDFQKRPSVEVDKAKWEADPSFRGNIAATTATAVPPTAGIPVTKKNTAQATTEPKPFVPVMSAQELAKLTEGWLKHGYINPNITTAKSLAAEDYKVPTFAEQTGVSLSDLSKQPPESINYLVEQHQTLATNLIMELIRMNIAGQKISVTQPSKSQVKAGLLVPKGKKAA